MVFPATNLAAFSLLILSFLCLGLWPLAFQRLAAPRRFEIFSFDFAVGSLFLALLAAYTLGTLGSELNFSDSMLVAGRRAQVMAFCGGLLFALGNTLLLCAISLVGLSRAMLLSASLGAAVLGSLAVTSTNYTSAIPGIFLFFIAALLSALASRAVVLDAPGRASSATATQTPRSYGYSSGRKPVHRKPLTAASKGIIAAVVAALALAGVLPVMRLAQADELAIGPYGGILMASLGVMAATPFINFYFMNLGIEGESLTFRAYLKGPRSRRVLGVAAGGTWAVGALALYVAVTAPAPVAISWTQGSSVPLGAVLLIVACGFLHSRSEPVFSAPSRKLVYGACLLLVCGAVLLLSARARA